MTYYDRILPPLPANCFASHKNMCWVYAGSFAEKDVPERFCADCSALQFVIMWRYGNVAQSAFSGANEDAKLIDLYYDEPPIAEVHEVAVESYEGWDYASFDDSDWTPTDEFADFPDELPPVTEERLNEILVEIVERESEIITEEESDDAFVEDGFSYLHARGNTHLVDTNEKSPYFYYRILNNDKESDVPNFIYVLYGRPSKENMRVYSSVRENLLLYSAEVFLDTLPTSKSTTTKQL